MTGQTGVATSWRVTQHRALFRQFVHDNVSKISYFQCGKIHHSLHCQVDKVLSANKPAMSFVEMSGEDFFSSKCLNPLQVCKRICWNQTHSQGSTNGNLWLKSFLMHCVKDFFSQGGALVQTQPWIITGGSSPSAPTTPFGAGNIIFICFFKHLHNQIQANIGNICCTIFICVFNLLAW